MTYFPSPPRKKILNMYWHFASERQAIFERRRQGELHPWTTNRILRDYKFCNVFRATDRVSQYMIRDVCYDETLSDADRVFNIVAFRTFSKPDTWEYLKRQLGRMPRIEDLETGAFLHLLEERRREGHGLYTGAFILCANKAYGHDLKHENHAALFHDMFVENDLAGAVQHASSMQEVYEALHGFPLMGDFMSYQTAVDLNYSTLSSFCENEFVVPGPGALRGIRKAFPEAKASDAGRIIRWMVEHQDEEFERTRLAPAKLGGRDLHLIDCQGLFCELDKYTREAAPEVAGPRTRIKAKFAMDHRPIEWFFPPKWNISWQAPLSPAPRPVSAAPI